MSANEGSFFRQVQQELKKVSWTTKEELFFCTKVVIIATLVFAIGIYFVDLVVKSTLSLLGLMVRFIGG